MVSESFEVVVVVLPSVDVESLDEVVSSLVTVVVDTSPLDVLLVFTDLLVVVSSVVVEAVGIDV